MINAQTCAPYNGINNLSQLQSLKKAQENQKKAEKIVQRCRMLEDEFIKADETRSDKACHQPGKVILDGMHRQNLVTRLLRGAAKVCTAGLASLLIEPFDTRNHRMSGVAHVVNGEVTEMTVQASDARAEIVQAISWGSERESMSKTKAEDGTVTYHYSQDHQFNRLSGSVSVKDGVLTLLAE